MKIILAYRRLTSLINTSRRDAGGVLGVWKKWLQACFVRGRKPRKPPRGRQTGLAAPSRPRQVGCSPRCCSPLVAAAPHWPALAPQHTPPGSRGRWGPLGPQGWRSGAGRVFAALEWPSGLSRPGDLDLFVRLPSLHHRPGPRKPIFKKVE